MLLLEVLCGMVWWVAVGWLPRLACCCGSAFSIFGEFLPNSNLLFSQETMTKKKLEILAPNCQKPP